MTKKRHMTPEARLRLTAARHGIGLYTEEELTAMFECGRMYLYLAVNAGQLEYISPNNRDRYIYMKDFIDFMKSQKEEKTRYK